MTALYGPSHISAVPMPTMSATANIAYEPPLPSEVVFGPELSTYSQLATSLSGQRAAMYSSLYAAVPVYSSLCVFATSVSMLLSTYDDYTASVRSGHRCAGAHYFTASATMAGVSTTASLFTRGQRKPRNADFF
jgi:hypothetical protein